MASDVGGRWPLVSIGGGPSGPSVRLERDGEQLRGVTGFALEGDARDVLRLRTYQVVKATVAVRVKDHRHAFFVDVVSQPDLGSDSMESKLLATAEADTIWQALYDCARQLELAAKEVQPGVDS